MSKVDDYRHMLRERSDWDAFLLAESGLPGPRGNIELAQAVADEGTEALFRRYIAWDSERAPTGTQEEFLAFCGTVGLGRLLAEGNWSVLPLLRSQASDARWRVREAVAMALQRLGRTDMDALVGEMQRWAGGNLLERRAAAAALCEPELLRDDIQADAVLRILDRITASILDMADRKSEGFKVLRQGLGYCWSVAVAALPAKGKLAMEKWLRSDDPDIRWIMRENLKKKRLQRLNEEWVDEWQSRLSAEKTRR